MSFVIPARSIRSSRIVAGIVFCVALVVSPRAHALGKGQRSRLIAVTVEGISRLSHTTKSGATAWSGSSNEAAANVARKNLRDAVAYVVDHAAELPLTQRTAIRLNKMLTRGMVNPKFAGDPYFRSAFVGRSGRLRKRWARYTRWADAHRDRDPKAVYDWLDRAVESGEPVAQPIEFAAALRTRFAKLDTFPDGNGRTANLLAALALIKMGHAPPLYPGYLHWQTDRLNTVGAFVRAVQAGEEALAR